MNLLKYQKNPTVWSLLYVGLILVVVVLAIGASSLYWRLMA